LAIQKVAILGGGLGSVITAWEITNLPNWQDRFDITIYQMGWRLGGKGASGRNAASGQRIEEHGLHMWMGFYENAFAIMRDVYAYCNRNNLMPGSPLQSYKDAFTPLDRIAITEGTTGNRSPWILGLPRTAEWPGDLPAPPLRNPDKLLWVFVKEILSYCVWAVEEIAGAIAGPFTLIAGVEIESAVGWLKEALKVAGDLASGSVPSVASLAIPPLLNLFVVPFNVATGALELTLGLSESLSRLRTILDTGLPIVRGVIADDVINQGFQSLDGEAFTSWIARHGCKTPHNPIITAFHDAGFAYTGGQAGAANQNMAAGTMLPGMLRLIFAYRGSMMFRMNVGMGDAVFAPLFLALKKRGVHFEFFQRVTNLGLSSDQHTIDRIQIDVQATAKNPPYDPLIIVKRRYCWPSEPKTDLLNQTVDHDLESWWRAPAPVTRRVLNKGEDFDIVVNGLALGTQPYVASEVIHASASWRQMVARTTVVRTQAFQLWLNCSIERVSAGPAPPQLQTGFEEPFDTWSDMSHLIPTEQLDSSGIAYFCNALPDDPTPIDLSNRGYPAIVCQTVKANAAAFLDGAMLELWPGAKSSSGVFDRTLLLSFGSGSPFDQQYYRANIDPPDLYVQSPAGSISSRLSPGMSGFGNMVLVGDWTKVELNIGCVETTVQSAMAASNAVCGSPAELRGAFGIPIAIRNGVVTT
jgi:uncharacterized protein with NAD-binding domain and iron-sulfur cluster